MSYVLLHVSDGDKHFSSPISEYYKRMKDVQDICISPEKNGSQEHIRTQETKKIISVLEKKYTDYVVVLLDIHGNCVRTEDVFQFTQKHRNIVFCIGGPYGFVYDTILPHVDAVWSWGYITMPHGLAKLVTLEQLYRAYTLRIGKKYHY